MEHCLDYVCVIDSEEKNEKVPLTSGHLDGRCSAAGRMSSSFWQRHNGLRAYSGSLVNGPSRRRFVRARPGIRVLTSHDPDQGDEVARGPVDLLA